MNSARQILRSARGDLLVESIAGTVIVAVALLAVSGVVIGVSTASASTETSTARTIFLNTLLADETPRIAEYTAVPTTVTRSIDGVDVQVSMWREDPVESTAILRASASGYSQSGPKTCSDPANLSGCLTASSAVALDAGGITLAEVPFTAGTGPSLGTASIGPEVQELRYVFKVTEAPADSTLHLAADPGTKTADIDIPQAQVGYYFGSIQVDPGSTLQFTALAGASIDPGSIHLYESPTP